MTIGSPIDSSIRRMIIKSKSIGNSVPDSQTNLDPAPQLVMEPGDEQLAFQYPDKLGDGRDQYEGYPNGGSDSSKNTFDDFISVHVEKPKNKTYVLGFDIPFPVEILDDSFNFGSGSGVVTFQSGTVNAGDDITMVVSGLTGTPADLVARLTIRRSF